MPYFGPDSEPSVRRGWRVRVWLSLWAIVVAAGSLDFGIKSVPVVPFLPVPTVDAASEGESSAILPLELRERATVDRRSPGIGVARLPGAGGTDAARPAAAAILPPEPLPTPGQCCRPPAVLVAVVLPDTGFFPTAHFPIGPPLPV